MSPLITLFMYFSILKDLNFQPIRKCINNGCTYPMKTSGYFISPTAKFTAGMKNCKYNFNSRFTGFMINTGRNTTTIIHNSNRIILINSYFNGITISCQGFIHGIVYNFIYKMMKTSDRSTTNIHTRSFTNCFKTFQYLDLIRSIFSAHYFSSTTPFVTLKTLLISKR